MRISNRFLAFSVLALAACAPAAGKPSSAPAAARVAPAAPALGTAQKSGAPSSDVTLDAQAGSASAPKPEAGKGTKEAFDGPPGIPTSIPGMPSDLPPIPGLPGGTGAIPGAGDMEGLNFKLPPCPPMAQGLTFGAGITGTIMMPKGDMALGAAKVTLVNALGVEQATTLSDGCGRFRFDAIMPGIYKVRFAVRTFRGEQPVTVGAGGVNVDLRVDVKFLQVAVFQGAWDHVEKILDKVGVPYELLPNGKLETTDLTKYNIVFINCTSAPDESGVNDTLKQKLKGFVGGGGALYVSDRSLPYILATWPGQVAAKGNTGNGGTKKHTVFDFQLGGYLRGALTVPIIYDMGGWRQLEKIQPATTLALLRDEKTQEPAILTFGYQNGYVGYTTYHQGAQMNDAMTFSLVFFITRL